MTNPQASQIRGIDNRSSNLYNKIRMFVMLTGFTVVTLVAISHSGNVSDTCRSEWNFINQDQPGASISTGVHEPAGSSNEAGNPDAGNHQSIEPGSSHLPDFDLIFPNLLFAL